MAEELRLEREESKKEELRHLVRIAATDLDGRKRMLYGLKRIKGVGIMFANAVCRAAGIDVQKKLGALTDEEIKRLDEIIADPAKAGIPSWLYNRRRDPETGADYHLIRGKLEFAQQEDIRHMKKIRCYKGVRHMLGQPVRGQRMRSNFRKNKGKVHLGVRLSASARKAGRV